MSGEGQDVHKMELLWTWWVQRSIYQKLNLEFWPENWTKNKSIQNPDKGFGFQMVLENGFIDWASLIMLI